MSKWRMTARAKRALRGLSHVGVIAAPWSNSGFLEIFADDLADIIGKHNGKPVFRITDKGRSRANAIQLRKEW